jgi:hypothetical protein
LIEHYRFEELRMNFTFIEKQNLNVYYLLRARYWLMKNNKIEMAQAMAKFNPLYKYSCLYGWVDNQWAQLNTML